MGFSLSADEGFVLQVFDRSDFLDGTVGLARGPHPGRVLPLALNECGRGNLSLTYSVPAAFFLC